MPSSMLLKNHALTQSPDKFPEILAASYARVFDAGQNIEMDPKYIWVVKYGIVQLSTLYANGDEALVGIATTNMMFGLPLTQVTPYQARALTETSLIRLSMAEIEQSPVLMQLMCHQLTRRLRQTEALLAMVGHRRVEDRLRHLLNLLAIELGQPVPDGMRLNVRLTHHVLAMAIGTTRVTITRLLGQLRQDGVISLATDRRLVIHSSCRLSA